MRSEDPSWTLQDRMPQIAYGLSPNEESTMFMPFCVLGTWLRGLFSIAIVALGVYMLTRWYDESHVIETAQVAPVADTNPFDGAQGDRASAPVRRVFRFEPGLNRQTGFLALGIALLTWSVAGRWSGNTISMFSVQTGRSDDEPGEERAGEPHRIRRPDGSELHVECYGSPDAPPLILTHGWGTKSTEWYYPKKHLADRFRVIVWDEPGLGLSKKPDNNDYRLEKLAADLDAVLTFAGGRPAVLVGHSIGGMIVLTFCKLFPEACEQRVAGLVLAHTTYTNPVRTARMAPLYTALEKPVLVPLLRMTIALWPLVWMMNWMSYLNGSARRSTRRQSFGGTQTLRQLDFATRFMPQARPDVVARGMFGMLAFDAATTLPRIDVPVLVIVGDQDGLTTPEAGQFITQSIPNARLAALAPAKHMGLIEHHSKFDRLVAEFTDSCQATVAAR
jgi:pimeloyl-ACP methyl ester carboxylesterase